MLERGCTYRHDAKVARLACASHTNTGGFHKEGAGEDTVRVLATRVLGLGGVGNCRAFRDRLLNTRAEALEGDAYAAAGRDCKGAWCDQSKVPASTLGIYIHRTKSWSD